MALQDKQISGLLQGRYEDLAAEYYNPARHPTCANFREASQHLIGQWLQDYPVVNSWICEVGSGKSVVAEQLAKRRIALGRLVLVDSSLSMLAYSKKWAGSGATLAIGDAVMLPLASESLDLIVSSLGDPYNETEFWTEVHRTLRPSGRLFFTTPSHDWALAFRAGSDGMTWAEFDLSAGRRILVPSFVYSVEEQVHLFEEKGLRTDRVVQVPLDVLTSTHLSHKLLLDRGRKATIVTGYLLIKR